MFRNTGLELSPRAASAPFCGLRASYLAGSIGLLFSFTGSAALAHSGPTSVMLPVTRPVPAPAHGPVSNAGSHLPPSGKTHLFLNTRGASAIFSGARDLDLASSSGQFSASSLGSFSQLTIDVGGKKTVLDMGSNLTGAELVAAAQVLSTGKQTLSLAKDGAASGGSLRLSTTSLSQIDSALGGTLQSLDLPKHVELVDSLSSLSLGGSLVNYGSVLAQAPGGSSISAQSLVNAGGASIISSKGTDLSLQVQNSIANQGTILSGNSLTMTAASITNLADHGRGGVVSAAQDISLNSPSIVNSGMIKSGNGSISFENPNSIIINNAGGTSQALKGNIDVRNASYAGDGDVTITGGNLLSQQLNLNAVNGIVDVGVNQVSGVVNANADCAHINAASGNLQLGNMNVSGDPTYFNETGNVIIKGILPTNGNDLAIAAGGSILSGGGVLDTNAATNGGTLTLVAGADFTTNGASSGQADGFTTLTFTPSNNATNPGQGTVKGGLIDLTGGNGGTAPISGINTGSTGGGNGGNVVLVAYAGSGGKSGTVTLPNSVTIVTGGAKTNKAGFVEVVAGGTSGTTINLGNIDTSAKTTSGSISIVTGTPGVASASIFNGTLVGSFGLDFTAGKPSMSLGTLTAPGASVFLTGGQNVSFSAINTAGIAGTASPGAAGSAGGNGGLALIKCQGNITGGSILTYGGGGGGGASSFTGGGGGNGGSVTLTTNGVIALSGGINAAGGGGGGGGGASDTRVLLLATAAKVATALSLQSPAARALR